VASAKITNIADEIKSRADIAEIIGRIVRLKKSGNRWLGLCPFHNEKTPSFFVNDDTQSFICFGCGVKGDVISFYEKYYNLGFLDAAEKLAGELGIDWTAAGESGLEHDRSALYAMNGAAARYYHDALIKNPDNPALKYLLGRGISPAMIKKFGLGYAESSGKGLVRHLEREKLPLADAEKIGLIKKRNGEYADAFWDRVIFPIINTRNKVIGFGGRAMRDGSGPKYLNSAESTIFQKKNNLYALNLSRSAMTVAGTAVLVEGYMDVISLYQHGIENVTASLGTALTPQQAGILKRYAPDAILSYDADEAGVNAAMRGMDILKDVGLNVKVLILKDTKDPDEFVRKHGKAAFEDALRDAIPAAAFKLEKARAKFDLSSPAGMVGFLKAAAGILRALSPVEADYYIRKVAAETGASEGALRMETFGTDAADSGSKQNAAQRDTRQWNTGEDRDGNGHERDDALDRELIALQRNLIRLLISDTSLLPRISEWARIFTLPPLYRIYENFSSLAAESSDTDFDLRTLEDTLAEADKLVLADLMDTIMLGEDTEMQLAACFAKAERKELAVREKQIIEVLGVFSGDDADKAHLIKELLDVQARIRELKER
jgi:DNA primase